MKKILFAVVIAIVMSVASVAFAADFVVCPHCGEKLQVVAYEEPGLKGFTIDPAQIPQEKLDTTVYLATSIRGLDNPYIVTITEGMKLFAEYLDSIGQKYEMQVLDSGGSNDREVDNMRQFSARAERQRSRQHAPVLRKSGRQRAGLLRPE